MIETTAPRVLNFRDLRVRRMEELPSDVRIRGRAYRLPSDAVRVDRGSEWSNPFRIGDPDPAWCGQTIRMDEHGIRGGGPMDRTAVLYHFRLYAVDRLLREPDWLAPLAGKRLVCWCAPQTECHASILLGLMACG